MSHQNQRGTKISIQIEQQVYYFGARLSIEITGGLIRKQNLRIGRKSARNCHPLLLTKVAVEIEPDETLPGLRVQARARVSGQTGVEMEALCGLNIALLTIWDLTKPINAALQISDIRLQYKSGGKKGDWVHPEGLSATAQSILDDR